ncbi:MAG TPA: SGNH/GDSL hydrolase family protein [Opitutaceae bacterium]|nr:SGNH/GDSL hydrolase family protein [Opitutaceae bacterium]
MKTILCYGDSNTHGADPSGGPRFDHHTRWPGVLRNTLGADYWIIEEGCGGRTTVWEDPIELHKNGAIYLPALLETHRPVDLVIILLGSNDLKHRFGLSADDIARGAGTLVDICKKSGVGPDYTSPPKVLLLAPPPLAPLAGTYFSEMFAGGEEKSHRFGECFRRIAAEKGCAFLDTGELIRTSPKDAVHFDKEAHAKLGAGVAQKIRQIL